MSPRQAQRETEEAPRLSVVLPHTDLALTEIALREAVRLAHGLGARVTVLAVRIVPFPEVPDPARGCPDLDELVAIAEAAGAPVAIRIVYARDWESACQEVLDADALVVIAVHHGWRRTREARLAGRLSRAGHKVTTVPA